MPLKANAVFKYGVPVINPDGGITFLLSCSDPGPNMPGDYTVTLSSAQVATVAGSGTLGQQKAALDAIVITAIQTQYRPVSPAIQAALNALPGQTVTIT